MKRFFQITLRVLLSLLCILLLVIGLLLTDWGQNWLAGQVTKRLSKELQNHISIDHVEIGFFNHLNLEGVLVNDRKKDTLLYAGKLQVRITDWFFLKDKVVLKYIGLEDAIINLNRTDSVWNYRFLQDYFAAPGTSSPKKDAGIEFNLKEVLMRNVRFVQKDAWVGNDLIARVGSLQLDANDISLSGKNIDINTLDLVRPYVQLHDYEGLRPVDSTKITATTASADSLPWNSENWRMAVRSLTLKDGTFRNDVDGLVATVSYFDPQHINFGKITGSIENLRLLSDTLRADVSLATKERSGFEVKTLKTAFRMHPQLMEFNNLQLRTNRSTLGNYFAMQYDRIGSMNRFLHAVTLQANFRNASLHSDDIAYFAPQISELNRTVTLSGKAKGTIDDLEGEDLTVQAGSHTLVKGDVSLVGLPDINSTFINIKADDLRTSYADAVSFVPALRSLTIPDLRKLTYLRFSGSFTGFLNDFVTYGTAHTNLGTLTTDLNMKIPAGKQPPRYSGSVSTPGFQLGSFLNNSQLGSIAFNGNIKGKGFVWNTLDMNIDGLIRSIQYNGYTFQNLTAKGRIARRTLDGDFMLKDPNADVKLTGLIDLSGKNPVFDAQADIAFANLKELQLTPDDLVLKGIFDLHFTGQTLSDFEGIARISSASLLHNAKPLSFDSLVVVSGFENGVKTLRIGSNELQATIAGNFDLESLPDAFTLFLNRYYPSYIKAPERALPRQSFTFDLATGVIEDYVQLFDKRLTGFNNSRISGSLDLDSNFMKVEASIPQAAFEQYQVSNVQLSGEGNLQRLVLNGSVSDAVVSDSLYFPQTTLSITAQNDLSDISLSTVANQTINRADLSARVQTFADGFKLLFNPSNFVINGKTWSIDDGGELDFRKNTVVHGQAVLRESNQEIRLSSQPSDIGNWNDLVISLQNLNLGDISPLLLKNERIEGLLTGEIHVEDPQNRMNITSTLRTEQLRLDNDSIGQVQASINYNSRTGLLSGKGGNTDPDHRVLFDLALDLNDSADLHRDRITVEAVSYPVKILERFIGDLFSDLQGYVTGDLNILGEGDNRQYVGKARLKDAGLKVNFTQVFYKLEDTELELRENEIDFGNITLHDRMGNTASMRGKIKHNNFSNMDFDIAVQVESKQMELLNTTYNDNQQFYGRAWGSGTFVLVGPQSDMLMNIDVVASETDSSYITIPPSNNRESGTADFMVERLYGREMTAEDYRGSATSINYQVRLTANPMVNMEVILDELTGDIIRGRGTGNLWISSGTSEPLTIRGRYEIQQGSYLFTFQSFFKKPFTIRPGANNFIEWTGDPYDAKIHIEAIYRAEEVSFAPLATIGSALSNSRINLASYREDVNVIAVLTGELFRPTFDFKLELPENLVNVEPGLLYTLQQIEKNSNELNKQVTYLIVFNSFAPVESQSGFGTQFSELAYNTLSGLLFGEVNKRLNQLLSKVLQSSDLTVNFTGSLYNRDLVNQASRGFNINQTNVNISVGKAFFDDRFVLTFGSTFDVPLQSSIQQTIQFLPDVTAEWVINKSGTIRAVFFYRQNLDFFSSSVGSSVRTSRTGASISYRREFDSVREFLFGLTPRNRKKMGSRTPANTTDSTAANAQTPEQQEQEIP